MVTKTISSCELIKAITVKEEDNAVSIAKKLHEFQERRIYVLNKKQFPIGIISIVDINDRVVAREKDIKKTKAKDIMSYPLRLIIDINEPLQEVAKKMVLNDNYYCPVVEKGILKGLLTYANLIKAMNK